jgi:hypothetical protein
MSASTCSSTLLLLHLQLYSSVLRCCHHLLTLPPPAPLPNHQSCCIYHSQLSCCHCHYHSARAAASTATSPITSTAAPQL